MSRRRILAIARAESIHNRRDPRSLIVIVLLPVVLLLIYGYGINFDLKHLPFAVQNLDGSDTARQLVENLRASGYFDLKETIEDRRQIDHVLDRGEVTFVLVLPPDMGKNLGAGREAQAQVIVDGADTTRANVAVGYIQAALSQFSARLGAEVLARQGMAPSALLSVHPTILYNPALTSVRFIVPGLIALLLTLLSALLTSTCIVREREWGSFELLVASPAASREIMIGKMIPYVLMAFADVILCIVAGHIIFGVVPAGSRLLLLSASAIFLLASLSIGILFSTIAPTQQLAILLAMLITLLPTTLLSGFAFPIRSMPLPLKLLTNIIPATHFLIIIRGIYLKAAGLSVLWPRLLVLAGFAVGLVSLAAKRFKKKL